MAEAKTRRVTFKMRKSDFMCLYNKATKLNIPWSEYIRNLILEDCKK